MSTAFAPTDIEDTHLLRVSKLLRHAEKAATQEEANAYLAKAQVMSTRYQIDQEVAKTHGQLRIPVLTQKHISIGTRGKRGLSTYVNLFGEIALANDVKYAVDHRSTYVVPFGFDTDIEIVEALYGSLVVQMVTASDKFLRSGEHRKDRVWSEARWNMVPVSGVTARINFQESFGNAVGHRLRTARKAAIAQAQAEQDAHFAQAMADGSNTERQQGAELVLHTKAQKVNAYYKATSNTRGSYRGTQSRSYSVRSANAGHDAGQRARIGGAAIGGSRKAIG